MSLLKQNRQKDKKRTEEREGNEGDIFLIIERVNAHIFKEIHLLKNVNGA